MKTIKNIYRAQQINMGGVILDQALPLNDLSYVDPFLLIHHWKQEFNGNQEQSDLGVGPHPHRGFAPVTLIFEGGLLHQDSLGNRSLVKKGGVQWMNAGKGIIHSERPSNLLARNGGLFEIIQFWINSPEENKMEEPSYQPLDINEIPSIIYDGGLAKVSIIAGEYEGISSRVKTSSDLLVLSLNLNFGAKISIQIPEGYNSMIYQLDGSLKVNDAEPTGSKNLIHLNDENSTVQIKGIKDSKAVIFAGKPLNEKLVSHGPFVMNTKEEIYEAINDFNSGKMGSLTEDFEFVSEDNI